MTKKRKREGNKSDSSTSTQEKQHKKKRRKHKKKAKKTTHSSPVESSLSLSESERELSKSKRHKKKRKRDQKDFDTKHGQRKNEKQDNVLTGPCPLSEMMISGDNYEDSKTKKRHAMTPMTKEEYEKKQSEVRRVFDPDSGRNRLVRGDGEIIEEVVSYERHVEINKIATKGDGASFRKSLGLGEYD
ncbi:ADP-ribosylation factor-like protein 6-interacting protein 4 [Xenia sp. Carnegie-2017]|uniref:ADP-ribosylation factor-like protein 6-interacting protein 4 n=1 Tax=Xenia sp. Carnegie-2017 TaxID=2897299 RepID=UPI001F045403|nr:ADP-ribosylation factor-like protein 6-interacting protein 4 [Xenia sp. Carnegie-2017]